jgi:hypothetical protein
MKSLILLLLVSAGCARHHVTARMFAPAPLDVQRGTDESDAKLWGASVAAETKRLDDLRLATEMADRDRTIADDQLKQCLAAYVPIVKPLCTIERAMAKEAVAAYEDAFDAQMGIVRHHCEPGWTLNGDSCWHYLISTVEVMRDNWQCLPALGTKLTLCSQNPIPGR